MWRTLELGKVITLDSGVSLFALAREPAPARPTLCEREHAVFAEIEQYPIRVSEWLAGRAAAKALLEQAFGLGQATTEVLPRESGAPEVYARGSLEKSVFLNITHTRKYAVAAAARFAVGVDVCDDADGHRLARIERRVFSQGEADECQAHASPQNQAAVWAIKEAVLKLKIGGVFDPGARSVRIFSLDPARVGNPGVNVQVYRLPDAACAVAIDG
jgi:phosphopantetheinyl transferase (holo-ACP synthase)